ncbi:hypothetical protein R6Q57_003708 [Mikania cordata]
MVSSEEQNSIYDIKISTVSAGLISGHNVIQELTTMDLAMKLHYLRFVYYFNTPTFDGLTILKIKETMFNWLNHAYIPCGRLRRADSVDDSRHKLLVPNQVLGPDLAFSPLVLIHLPNFEGCFMQLTDFKCGGKSVGISWSHVLGDVFSAVGFINLWAQEMEGHYPTQPLTMAQQRNHTFDFQSPNQSPIADPMSTKRVGPVGDLWSTSNHSKMEPFFFHISSSELTRLQV